MKEKVQKIAVITGVSGGIGFATAKRFIKKGYTVYGLSRGGIADAEEIKHVTCDLTDDMQVAAALEYIVGEEGRIDCLINNAGMGIAGPAEDVNMDAARYIFEVNFFAAVKTVKAAAGVMRVNGGGHIVNVSSVGGIFPIPFQGFYSATKAALAIFSETLRIELKPFNIKVAVVLPGDVRTNFTASRQKDMEMPAHYAKKGNKSIAAMEKDEMNGMKPEKVARAIYRLATRKNPPPLKIVGFKYKLFALLNRFLPRRFVDWLVGKVY